MSEPAKKTETDNRDKRTAPSIAADKRTAFPCSLVVLNADRARRIPGDDCAKRVLCLDEEAAGPRERWTALWFPALQVFEVTWFPALRSRAPEVTYLSLASVESFNLKPA